jgi:membrane-associated phospholipid phosphatase
VILPEISRRFLTLDFLVFGYTAWIAVFAVVFWETMPNPAAILALHLFILTAMLVVTARGAAWEAVPLAGWRRYVRNGARFFRYTYPLLLVLFFFEEGHQTVNAMWPEAPYWFESWLYAAELRVFGELPVLVMNDWVGPIQDELAHMFYFSYYFIFVGGVIFAFFAGGDSKTPAPGFDTAITSVLLAFLLCFVWYPFLPARGPWENPELMAAMTPFEGFVFVPIVERIIAHGAVSGGCFPSSHVAGAWATVFGLWGFHRKPALILGLFAVGMSFGCVYTRYHHGVDIAAGFTAAVVAALISYPLTVSKAPAE